MGSKLVFVILALAQICYGDILVETEDDLKGFTVSETYFAAAADLPASVPAEIKASDSAGIWLYEETRAGGVVILTLGEATYSEINIKCYSSVKASVYFQDQALEAPEIEVVFPATNANEWTTYNFDLPREVASSEAITFRIQFPEEKSKNGYFLLDSVNLVGTLTTPNTTPSSDTTPAEGGEQTTTAEPENNSSAAIFPSIITFVVLGIVKAFL